MCLNSSGNYYLPIPLDIQTRTNLIKMSYFSRYMVSKCSVNNNNNNNNNVYLAS